MASSKPSDTSALQKSREIIFELSRDFLGNADSKGYFTALNPAWERTFGFPLETLMAHPFIEFVDPADRERTVAETSRVFSQEGTTVGFENRYMV